MVFRSRKLIKPEDLNPRGTLFGGTLLKWVDEEAAIFAICQLDTSMVVTKIMSEVNFISPAYQGDIIEIGLEVIKFGKTSITLLCVVQNKTTKKEILKINNIVFVCVGDDGKSIPHGKTMIKEE